MRSTIPILMYHSVDDTFAPEYSRWSVTRAKFSEQLEVLRKLDFNPVTVSELASVMRKGSQIPARTVAITFDDGLLDFKLNALPIMETFQFSSTLYVTTKYVGGTSLWLSDLNEGSRSMMDWSDIASLPGRNVEVGAHTHSHPQLDLLNLDLARGEIETSKRLLQDCIGKKVKTFAYPHGYSTRDVRELVKEAGFESACRVGNAQSHAQESVFALSRIIMTEDVTPHLLERYLLGSGLPVSPALVRPTAIGWRLFRKARAMTTARPSVSRNDAQPCESKNRRKSKV